MSRLVWSRILVVVLALPLASCFDRGGACPTCPPDKSARIAVVLPLGAVPDSLHVTLDGGTRHTLRRGGRVDFPGLAAGGHTVVAVRWYFKDFALSSKTSSVEVRVEAGELRVVNFHNDVPLITDASARRRAGALLAIRLGPPRVG